MQNSKTFLIFIMILQLNNLLSQRLLNTNTNTWINYTGTYKVAGKWSIYLESQLRRNEVLAAPQQFLIRPAVQYNFNGNIGITVGYLFVHTNVYGSQPAISSFGENRTWQQLQIKSQQGQFEFINRVRLEQRWVNIPVIDASGAHAGDPVFSSRMRIQNRVSIPFKGKTIEDKSWYLLAGDEIMLNFGKNVKNNIFDQNRIFSGIGYKLPKLGRLECGYLYQKILKGDGIKVEGNHTLSFTLFHNMNIMSKQKQSIP